MKIEPISLSPYVIVETENGLGEERPHCTLEYKKTPKGYIYKRVVYPRCVSRWTRATDNEWARVALTYAYQEEYESKLR